MPLTNVAVPSTVSQVAPNNTTAPIGAYRVPIVYVHSLLHCTDMMTVASGVTFGATAADVPRRSEDFLSDF